MFWRTVRYTSLVRRKVAHARDAERLVIRQIFSSQRYCVVFFPLALGKPGIVMAEEDTHDKREQPEESSPSE